MSHIYDSKDFGDDIGSVPYESYLLKYASARLSVGVAGEGYGVDGMNGDVEQDREMYKSQLAQEKDLEQQAVLHNEKRLFTCLFSKSVPPVTDPDERKEYPRKNVNLLNRGVFFWLWPILYKGYKRTLLPDDLWYLPEELKVEYMHNKFDQHLSKRIEKAKKKHLKQHQSLQGFEWSPYLIPLALYDTFFWQYTLCTTYLALSFVCQGLSPLLTKRLIDFVENKVENDFFGISTSYNKGIGYTIGSVALIFINGLFLNHFFHNSMTTGAQSKAILTKSLLLKSFKLSGRSRNQFSVGRVTSIMSTDLARIDLALGFQPLIFCFPILVVIAVALLLVNIGVSSLAGIGLFVVSLAVCVLSTKQLFATREKVVGYTDERIGLMREVLNNLKIIKFYAWELAYQYNISEVRQKEMKYLFSIKVLRDIITSYAVTLPTLTSMISFVTLWASNSMKSPGKTFSSLSLFSILAQAVMLLPIALATGADALIGFARCRDYLNAEEHDDVNQYADSNKGFPTTSEFEFKGPDSDIDEVALEVKHANFVWDSVYESEQAAWDLSSSESSKKKEKKTRKFFKKTGSKYHEKEEFYRDSSRSSNETCFDPVDSVTSSMQHPFPGLTDINLTIKKNEFVIITGSIGSGKSALLSALSGFMRLSNPSIGRVNIHGDVLLCSTPWIQNATVRENITFGRPYDPVKYDEIVSACCLNDDLSLLPARDLTEIGERGITLSGGQKARINLARACYSSSDILLFDDVLSAVDSRVGKHIVSNLFNDALKDKTRILATHQLSLIGSADRIIYLNGDGTVDSGSFEELCIRNNQFKRLVEYNIDITRGVDKNAEELNNPEAKYQYDKKVYHSICAGDVKDETGRITADEERATNAISWEVYKRYISLGSGVFGKCAAPLFIFLVALATFVQLFTNTWLSFWVESKFKGKSDHFYVGLYVMFAVLTVIFTAIEFTMLVYMNNRAAKLMNVRAVAKILHVPMSFMDTNPIGRVLNRFTKDTDSLDNEIGEQLRLFVFPLAIIIGINILCICYLPWYAIAVPFLGFGYLFLANFYQGSSREIKRLEALQRSLVYNNFNETLTGMSTIRAYKAEHNFIAKNDFHINKMNEAYYISIANQRWLAVHLDMIASCFALIICLLCITDQFNISASSTGLLLSYVIQIIGLLSLTVRSMTQVENEMNSVERLHTYAFHLPQEAEYQKPETAPPAEWPSSGYIQFNHVSLRYRDNLPLVLRDLNFNVYPGEKIGICGKTGAGKSSIMTALYRLAELDLGNIVIDGLDIANLGLRELRSKLSIIPQDPVLFQGSIRRNLDPFNQSNDDILWDALRRSGLIDGSQLAKIKETKLETDKQNGYEALHKFHLDQVVAQDGANFSLGERQLIALARALVRNTKILILDEATSSVDFETDAKIQDTIADEFSNCTILCIAHRLRTILNYDRIIVVDEGRIIEKGTPWKLFNDNNVFRQMCDKANIEASDF